MKLKTEDILKQKLLDEQENVRDYQEYSDIVDDDEVHDTFKQFAKESAIQAQKLQQILGRME